MNNKMVAHLWAQQEKPRAKGSNFYFEGPTIFSYGGHFPIAKFVTNKKGERAVVFTSRRYSVSTSRHVSYARSALPDMPVFYARDPLSYNVKDEIKEYKERIEAQALRVARARAHKTTNVYILRNLVDEANDFARFHGSRTRFKSVDTADYAQLLEEAREHQRKAQKALERKNKAAIEEWRSGARSYLPGGIKRVFLRLRVYNSHSPSPGDKIETSKGAQFPVSDALKVWDIVCHAKDSSTTYAPRDKPRLGNFSVDEVTAKGDVKAGCHFVEYAEIQRIAKQLHLVA